MAELNSIAQIEIRPGPSRGATICRRSSCSNPGYCHWNEEGLSADEIVSMLQTLSLADVHAATCLLL